MARKATTSIAEALIDPEPEEVEEQPVAVATPEPEAAPVMVAVPTTKSAKIKGTWTMHWGAGEHGLRKFDFVDGNRYEIPIDLFDYLKRSGNIYDTL